MEQITRENFPYEGIAQELGYSIDGGINEAQREMLYEGSVNRHLEDKLKEFTGKGQSIKAVQDTISRYADARELLGVPEEIIDSSEPFTREKVLGFYEQISPENRNLKAKEFLTKYSNQFYDSMQPLERPFLNELNKTLFKSKLTDNLSDEVDFENDTVSDLITKLTPITPEQLQVKAQLEQENKTNESKGLLGESAEFVGNIGRGFYNASVDTVSGSLRLTDSTIDFLDGLGNEVVYDPETGDFLQRETILGVDEKITDVNSFNNPEPGKLWNAANAIQDALESRVESDDFGDKVATGIGQIGSMLTGGGILKFLTGGTIKPVAGSALVGITQGGESGYDDYIQSIEEQDGDFNLGDAKATFGLNALIGASEVVPFLKPLSKLTGDGKAPVGALLNKIDQATGGIIGNNLKKVAQTSLGKAVGKLDDTLVGDFIKGGVAESTQEVVAGMAQDFVAANIVQYDQEREVFVSDETIEGGEVGGVVGALMNSLLGALGRKRAKKIKDNLTGTPNDEDVSSEPLVNENPAVIETNQPEPTIRRGTNQDGQPVVAASRGGIVGTGINDAEALADLDERVNREPVQPTTGQEIPTFESVNDYIIETENLADESGVPIKDVNGNNVQTSTLKTERGDVTFTGPNAESQLTALIESDQQNPDDPTTRLQRGTVIAQDVEANTYTVIKDEFSQTGEYLTELITSLNESVGNKVRGERIASVRREQPNPPVTIPITVNGFIPKDIAGGPSSTQSVLKETGFTLLPNPKSKINPVTKTGFKVYKDGFIYTVQTKGKKSSKESHVTVEDLDGFKYRLPQEEAVQNFTAEGKVVTPTGRPLDLNNLNTSDRQSDLGGIVLNPPRKGIEVLGRNVANSDGSPATVFISADSVNNVADRLGIQPTVTTSDFAILEKGGNYIELFLTDQNDLAVTINGESILVDGDFDIVDGDKFKSLSIMTQELERNEYKVIEVTDKSIILQKDGSDGPIVELRKYQNDVGVTTSGTGNEVKVDNLTGLRALLDLPQLETESTPFDSLNERQQENLVDDLERTNNRTEVIQLNNEKAQLLFDTSEESQKVQIVNGVMKIINQNGPDIVLDVPDVDRDAVLESIRLSTVIPMSDIDLESSSTIGSGNSHRKRVDSLLSNLPLHIRKLIIVHETRPNPASDRGANGVFIPTSPSGKPEIHIDINPSRDYSQIVKTISEEVAHFSFDSWNLPQLTKLYDGLYSLVKSEISASLPQYIKDYGVNVDAPTDYHKWVLVNEFFSKQGTTFLDFNEINISRPPGITDEDVKRIKKEVNDGIRDFTINLRDDFTGDPNDAKEMMLNILRLQTAGALSGGIGITYKTTGANGEGEVIQVRNTPYGSHAHVRSDTQAAARTAVINKRIKGLRENGKDTLANLWTFYYKDVNPFFGNTMLGRVIENKMANTFKPVANKTQVYLNKMNSNADIIQALLDSTGLPDLTITDSYSQAFIDSGALNDTKSDGTLGKKMKRAKEADEFLREALKLKNNNVATIRQLFRDSKAIATRMASGIHNDAKKNLPEWLRLLNNSMERFTVMWDHRAYSAFTKSGQGNMTKMFQELNGDGRVDIIGDAKVAQKEMDSLRKKGIEKLSIREQKNIADLKNKVRLKKQFDGLNEWARLKLLDQGIDQPTKQVLSEIKLQRLTRITSYNRPSTNELSSGADNKLADAEKARRLDPQVLRDRHYMDFLGLIEDPMMVSLANLEQQNDVIHKYKNRNELAEMLVQSGISKPIGSTANNTFYSDQDKPMLAKKEGDNYNLLNFITSTDVFQEHLGDAMGITEALHSDVVDSFLNQFVRTVKAGYTVFNRGVAMANYIGNLPLLVNSGVLSYLHRDMNLSVNGNQSANFSKFSATTMKEAWVDRIAYGHDEFNLTPEQMVLKEMESGDVLDISAAAFESAVGSSAWLSSAIKGVATVGNKLNLVTTPGKVEWDARVELTLNWLRKFYTFGDDFAKVPVYLINRQLGIEKAKTELNRDDFEPGDVGESKYVREIVSKAVDYATERTNRETTNYPITSASIKRNSRNFLKLIVGDFMMHPQQMFRIGIENAKLFQEDTSAWNKAKADGHVEYAELLGRRVLSRGVGMAATYGTFGLAWYGALSVLGHTVSALQNMWYEDDEEDKNIKLENRKTMSEIEYQAAYKISNIYTSQYGSQPLTPMYRDGNNVYFIDDKRLNALASPWAIPAPPTEEGHTVSTVMSGFLGNFININNQSIFSNVLDRTLKNVDRWGDPITPAQGWAEVLTMPVPIDFKDIGKLGGAIYDVVVETDVPGYDEETGGPDPQFNLLKVATKQLGVKISSLDMRSVMNVAGRQTANMYNKKSNPDYGSVFKTLSAGDELTESEIVDVVNDMSDEADAAASYFNNSVNQFRSFGYDEKTIKQNYTKQYDNSANPVLGKDNFDLMVNGGSGPHEIMVNRLKGKLKNLKTQNPNYKKSRQDIINEVVNYEKAIKKYESNLKKMKGQ